MTMPVPVPAGGVPGPGPRNATQRPLLRRWLAAGVLVTLFLAGGAVLFMAFDAEFGLPTTFVALLAALLPLTIVVPGFLWLDRAEAEPVGLLLSAFGWGAFVATSSALFLNSLAFAVIAAFGIDAEVVGSVLVAPMVEEVAKGLGVLMILVLRRDEFDGVLDGIVYAGIVAAGFAFGENILYLGRAVTDGGVEGLVAVLLLRGVISPFAHPLFTVWTGIGIGVAVAGRSILRFLAPVAGLVLAIALHAAWNGGASFGLGGWAGTYLLVHIPVFIATILFALAARRREERLVAEHLGHYARYGIYDAADLQMLSSPRGRRAARSWARGIGGRRASSAMQDFQDDSVELAFLRARVLRRPATAAAAHQERVLVESVLRARAAFRSSSPSPVIMASGTPDTRKAGPSR